MAGEDAERDRQPQEDRGASDGTEQNDLVTEAGSVGFQPPPELRVDNSTIVTSFLEPVRLPYLKFPRNPEGLKRGRRA